MTDKIREPGEVTVMSEEEYTRTFKEKPRESSKAKTIYLTKIESRARDVIRSLGSGFSFELFPL